MPRPDDEFDDDDRPRRRRDEEDDDYDDEDDDRPRRRRRTEDDLEPVGFIVPVGVSPLAIISLYAGLIGFCLPLIGLVFAIPALICGVIALRRAKRSTTYGGATSNVRAIIGVVLSGLGILIWGTFGLLAVVGGLR